jgi:hypothetical protein
MIHLEVYTGQRDTLGAIGQYRTSPLDLHDEYMKEMGKHGLW